MTLNQLFETLAERSLRVRLCEDLSLELVGDLSRLDRALEEALRANRQIFFDLLGGEGRGGGKKIGQADPQARTPNRAHFSTKYGIRLGREDFEVGIWSGERLRSPIAIDTETELIEGFRVPRLALASVSDGRKTFLIEPGKLQAFVDAHSDAFFVAHNAAFDFAVIRDALSDPLRWVEVADQGRLHDTMILDALIRLGREDAFPQNRDLGSLAKTYLGVVIDKDDPFRLRFGELIGRDWGSVDPGFFRYAAKDAIATRKLWDVLSAIAAKLIAPFKEELLPESVERFGLLTESLQVRGAIALAEIERLGIEIDQGQVESTKRKLEEEIASLVSRIEDLPEAEGLFKREKSGSLTRTASGKPTVNQNKLRAILEGIVDSLSLSDVPRTEKTKTLSTSIKFWGQFAEGSLFLSLWVRLEEVAKLCQFFAGLKSKRINPRYSLIVRTGRTSCRSPNIQQLPRSGGFREMIVPSPGFVFLGIDYSAIELRTLAAVCERRFGRSRLAEVIREGVDPHSFTAAIFAGVSLGDFGSLPNKKQLRQQAKALNFGIPGGLGAKSLVEYAKATYGVDLTVDQASEFRERLISEVYPELSKYLEDDPVGALAHNLKTSAFRVRACFESDGALGALKRIVSGRGKSSGKEYGEAFVSRCWESLSALNQNRKLADRIERRETGEQLARDLFFGPVVTLTGRLRGRVGFSQARNTPFSGLAADGAKLALWGLYRAGFRTVAFVHDEALIELPEEADHTEEAKRIDSILCEAMEQLTGSVPIACEYALADRWYKGAEAIFDDQGRLRRWLPS